MKKTFASKIFASKTFASGTWAGLGVTTPPTGTFSEKAIQASFYTHFRDNFSAASASYDGEMVDFDSMEEVVDVEMQSISVMVHRKHSAALQRETVFVNAIVYVKKGANMYRGADLAGIISEVWDQTDISVQDFDVTGSPQVGTLRMKECQVFDQTRELNDHLRSDWTKHVVQSEGTAQET